MVVSSDKPSTPPEKKGGTKVRRPPLAPLSFPRLVKSRSLLLLGGDKPTVPEPDYEEVGPPRKKPNGTTAMRDASADGRIVKHCDLCGSSQAAVRCEKCGSQAFCLACDDMYHRHPKRSTHARKTVESGTSITGLVRPPLPPKGSDTSSVPPPQPPPRKNKKPGFLSSGAFTRRDPSSTEGAGRTIMGSLKRIMGSRPLPPPPDIPKRPEPSIKSGNIPSRPSSRTGTRPATAPAAPNQHENGTFSTSLLPQSVIDLNTTMKSAAPTGNSKYQSVQAKATPPPVGPHRKLSLQQVPSMAALEDKRASMVESSAAPVPWDTDSSKVPSQRIRSQSVSDEQWAQMMAAQTGAQFPGQGHPAPDIAAIAAARRGFNTIGSSGSRSNFNNRGMVSSASVCDLNTLATQQQPQHSFNAHGANSFQQLNMMGYGGGMMWAPPCELCQGPPMGYPNSINTNGMKRTASNLSMNLSSMGSEVSSGYPWAPPSQPPHVHHHMPPYYPGFYPPPGCHPHMGPGMSMQGSAVSIPDAMQTFNKVPSSPAPSVRSTSHRSHKSSKSRSFSNADSKSRRSKNKSRRQSEESEDSRTSSGSEGEVINDDKNTKSTLSGSGLAWQCDHCTFINPGNARTCGMCSKTTGSSGSGHNKKGNERRRNDRRRDRDRRTDHDDDDHNVSDYDNDNAITKSNLSFNIKDSKRDSRTKVSSSNKNSNKGKKKSRRRDSSVDSASPSISDIEDEERQLERQLKELRMSARSRQGGDYESTHGRSRDKDRSSRKREGKRT